MTDFNYTNNIGNVTLDNFTLTYAGSLQGRLEGRELFRVRSREMLYAASRDEDGWYTIYTCEPLVDKHREDGCEITSIGFITHVHWITYEHAKISVRLH